MKDSWPDILMATGIIATIGGTFLLSPPAALIVVGLWLVFISLMAAYQKSRKSPPK